MSQSKNYTDLESNILFEGVNSTVLESFANPKNTIGKKEGSVVYQKGDLTEYLYLLIEGAVKLKFTEPDGTNIYVNKSANSFFGETELLGKTQRKSSAVADTDCRMYTFNIGELKMLIKKDKQILKNLYKNKTFDVLEEDFIESTKDFLDPDTDFAGLIKTTEKLEINHSDTEEESTLPVENDTENGQGSFDKIITNDEDEEDEKNIEKTESDPDDEIVNEDNSIVLDETSEEGKDNLKESEGFIIDDAPGIEFKSPDEIVNFPQQDEEAPEPELKENEEPEVPTTTTTENEESDYPDYYEALLKATQNIFSKITLDETAESVAESAANLVNAAGGVVYLVDKQSEELTAKVLSDNSIKDIRIKYTDGLQGNAVIEKKCIIVENPHDDKNFNPAIEDLTGIKIKNVIYYPVMTKTNEVVAVIELYNSERGKFDSLEIELLNAISPSIQRALGNSKYVDIITQQRKILSLGEITEFITEDIKSSLLKVKHYSSLLKKKNPSPEFDKLLDLQIGQINSVEDFLKFTDAYAHGKNSAKQSTIKVSEAATQILNFLAEYLDSRNTVIFKKIEEDAVINVDLPSMYFVCYQIAKNACDAMEGDGQIFVTSERDGNYIKIKLRDTGVGISETIKDKIFKPFITYGKKQRPGLGLAIAEKIVSDQGGYMMAESVLGEGSTLIIALPVVF